MPPGEFRTGATAFAIHDNAKLTNPTTYNVGYLVGSIVEASMDRRRRMKTRSTAARSKEEFRGELNDTRVASSRDRAEGGGSEDTVRCAQRRRVRGVEHFRTYLERRATG